MDVWKVYGVRNAFGLQVFGFTSSSFGLRGYVKDGSAKTSTSQGIPSMVVTPCDLGTLSDSEILDIPSGDFRGLVLRNYTMCIMWNPSSHHTFACGLSPTLRTTSMKHKP